MVKSAESVVDDGSESLGSVAPFLRKCYDMVDDESTDEIISWSDTTDCFVIWDMTQFSVRLLPKYFKHRNFSSFMRQLNIYGFRKVDTDRWIFANDGFVRGQKHLLKNISRKRTSRAPEQRKASEEKEQCPAESPEKVQNDLWKEVENLKIDKNALMQELVKLRQHHETSENNLLVLRDRLQGMEKNQQQMLSFLVMAMQYPGYFVKLLQSKENHWRVAEAGNMLEEGSEDDMDMTSDGMIVRYQPPPNGTSSPGFPPIPAAEKLPQSDFYTDGMHDFFTNSDFMKVLMDEKLGPLESHAPFILPDWTDDGSWEQLLLSSPFWENAEETQGDGDADETTDTRMKDDSTSSPTVLESQDFDSLVQMENSQNFGMESTDCEANLVRSQNLDNLADKMGLLASDPEKMDG